MSIITKVKNKVKRTIKAVMKKQQKPLKNSLSIIQEGKVIHIKGTLNYGSAHNLILHDALGNEIIFANTIEGKQFHYVLDADYITKELEGQEDIFNCSIELERQTQDLSEAFVNKKLEEGKVRKETETSIIYPILLGRFPITQSTSLKPIETDYGVMHVYISVKGNIRIGINKDLKSNIQYDLKKLYIKNGELSFYGNMYTKHSTIEKMNILLVGRDRHQSMAVSVDVKHLEVETTKKFGLNRYDYHVHIDLKNTFNVEQLQQDVYDLFFEVFLFDKQESVKIRIGKPRYKARNFTKTGFSVGNDDVFLVMPYFTFKALNLSLQVEKMNREAFDYLQKVMKWRFFYRLKYHRKNIWLVGERPYKAQDTGYHFFKYMREKQPDKNVYYVIEKDSPELKNIEHLGNVVYFNSKEHILYTLVAKYIIGSHHADYLFPVRTKDFSKAMKAKRIFLQHGVMGVKNMVANYGKKALGFKTDLFLVSSDFERQMIINDFGYDKDEVFVTGLPRFDHLFKGDIEVKKQILIIPTWRDWLLTDEVFLQSDYFNRYMSLLHSEKLHSLSKEHNFEIIFCLHPNMQKYTEYFKDAPIRVISQGEVDVQRLLKESALMITDYSSVNFDFSFLHKPVIFYQFDRERFLGKRPSHLNLDYDLAGEICFDEEKVLNELEHYVQNNFTMEEKFVERTKKFLKYRDRHSSERVYSLLLKKQQKVFSWKKLKVKGKSTFEESEFFRTAFRVYRKSKLYFPTQRFMYRCVKLFAPVDKKLIVFESGLGKQYSDSPKYIYEELLQRNLDYKIVWIVNNSVQIVPSENTKRVVRLSPKYFYYLARARYWINNQNFPNYIKKRKGTTYIQTWHGTPLKRMLYDIEQIHGRDEGYLERVTAAISNWDYLISPSAYATKAFKSAFQYKKEVLEIGYPRNDLFYKSTKEDRANRIKQGLKLPTDKKVILYAPTFRDNQTQGKKFTFDLELDLNRFVEELGDEYILLLRMHVLIGNKIQITNEMKPYIFDVSKYSDIQELYLISDILITDYSSVFFDYANTKRPMIFYTYDLELYRDQLRGFYLDFENDVPGPIVKTNDELFRVIREIDETTEQYAERYNKFYNTYCYLEDGCASKRVVDSFFDPQTRK